MIRDLLGKADKETKKAIEAQFSNLKKQLKQLSKNELITLVLQQVEINVENQNINKLLAEKLKELQEKKV